jgi:hypothetical protein
MRKWIIIALLLGAAALPAGYFGLRTYQDWKKDHLLELAKGFLAKGDGNNGLLALRKAIDADPFSVEACSLMADFAETARSPSAVFWRNRLVELQPDSVTNRLSLVRVAMAGGDFAAAAAALQEVKPEARKGAAYHKVAAALAASTGQWAEAESHFAEIIAAEPGNPVPRVSLAMLRVQRADPAIAAEAREELKRLSLLPEVRVEALRYLALDGLRTSNHARAASYAEELLKEKEALFTDRLLQLDILRAASDPRLRPALAAAQEVCGSNGARVFEVSRWMLIGTTPGETLAWLQSLPPRMHTNLPAALVVADAYAGRGDWQGLQQCVEQQSWGEMEYLRLAYRTRALREQGMRDASQPIWNATLRAADSRLDRLIHLERVMIRWNWIPELEEVLWTEATRFPGQTTAAESLSRLLHAAGKTRSLLILYARQQELRPADLEIRNNIAVLSLLLNAPEHRPHDLARKVFEAESTNAYFASTYAYSLYCQDRLEEAIAVFAKVPAEALEDPAISGYYGLLLAASGDMERARHYFERTSNAALLPEERALFRIGGI